MTRNCKCFNGRALTETATIMKIQNFVRLLWIDLEGHMQMNLWKAITESVKTYKNCNIAQDLIDNFTSVRAIIHYLIYRGSITITFIFFSKLNYYKMEILTSLFTPIFVSTHSNVFF